jgi:LacI family gluconate utilization system Gnt-I transcriptional repressor
MLREMEGQDQVGIGCSNDLLALGAIFEAQRRQVAIPEQCAIIGFGDLEFSASCNPALSTIKPFGDLIGSEAARLILKSLADGEARERSVIDTGFGLVHRQTS